MELTTNHIYNKLFKKALINRSRKLLSNTEAKAHTKQFADSFSSVSDWRFQFFFYKQETSEGSYTCINAVEAVNQ